MKNVLWAAMVCLLAWAPAGVGARQDQDSAVIDAFIARQARQERGEEYKEARKVVTGDLNRDGVADTAVLYTIEGQGGSNNHTQYLAVFVRGGNGLTAAAHAAVGGKFNRSVELRSVSDDTIHLGTLEYTPKDPACCPSKKGATDYVLAGSALREQRRPPAQSRRNQ
jgi:hypothetical protein